MIRIFTLAAFLVGAIQFPDIARINETVLGSHEVKPADSVDVILKADREAREMAQRFMAAPAQTSLPQAV